MIETVRQWLGRKKVPLSVVGVDLRAPPLVPALVPGEDFPRGVEHIDTKWFRRRVEDAERIAACDTDEKLRALRAEAVQVRLLESLQAMATGAPRGGG